jgi:tetratricopeptide (TPR) repeat protein
MVALEGELLQERFGLSGLPSVMSRDMLARCLAELAEAAYREALALAEALRMRPLQAHCHRGLGTLYDTTGQREQARAELSIAIELYEAMDMTFWLPQAEAALVQVEGR